MKLVDRFRLPAISCALAVLVCELIAQPYANMGICDDGPYVLMARTLAATGHIAYNGWAAAMIVAQLYLGAAFIKLFGFSFTTVRMSTLFISLLTAFLLQRTLVRTGISEFNASLGTLALVLSPLYLMLSVTFMSDITGLFAIILCLYGCLRALQSSTDRSAIAWLCCAIATNALFGTSRQIAWLGILVMVPSTLWLLRSRRRVLLAGAASTFAGALFILACMHWLKHQPYIIQVPLYVRGFSIVPAMEQLGRLLLDVPFLLLPIFVLFVPEIRKSRPRVIALFSVALMGYLGLAMLKRHLSVFFPLEPTQRDWVNVHGMFDTVVLQGTPPILFHKNMQILLTIASFCGMFGVIVSLVRSHRLPPAVASAAISWKKLIVLLAPFSGAYALILVASQATTHVLFDRYSLGLLVVALICLIRCYQERIHARLPRATILLLAITAIFGVAFTHNTFSFDRARVALAAEVRGSGVPDTSVDNGWEYNFGVELQHSDFINHSAIALPADAYVPNPPPSLGTCSVDSYWYDKTPHIHPIYGVSFDPNACYGLAPFAPMHYSVWPASGSGTLYVVRYLPPSNP